MDIYLICDDEITEETIPACEEEQLFTYEQEKDENFAVIVRSWEYLPFWLKAKILLMCMFYAWRNRLWQRLGLQV